MPWVDDGRGWPPRWEHPEPWEGRTCAECRFSCRAYEAGHEAGPLLCLVDAMDPKGQASAYVVGSDDPACESFED